MENDIPVAVEAYRSPEIKVTLKAMTDPRPHKLALSYLKAKARLLLGHQKQALWTRPIDDLAYVAQDGVRTVGGLGGAMVGSNLAGLVSNGNPLASIAGGLSGAMLGSYVAGKVGDAAIQGGINAAEEVGMMPEALTHVNIMSKRQSNYSNLGSALGVAGVIPLATRVMMKSNMNPLLALSGALGSAYLLSRIGNAAGNIAGYYADRRDPKFAKND